MSDQTPGPELSGLPSVVEKAKTRWAPQIIWIIPIIAILVGLGLAYKAVVERGPTITIHFKSGDGLEAGKTNVKYKEVNIGLVKTVILSEDHQQVIATIQLNKDAADFLKADTRFWIVRPRINASGVSGLSTLLDGPFIAADLGKSNEKQDHFVALEIPPILTSGTPGREFILKSLTLGSVGIGVPIYFRRLTVGEVVAYDLEEGGNEVAIKIFIHAPYDQYVKTNTRFWNASGVDVNLNANGLQIQTESLVALIAGGIAFESPLKNENNSPLISPTVIEASKSIAVHTSPTPAPDLIASERASADTVFPLFPTRTLAMRQPDSVVVPFVINFKQSVRGLSVGAPVEFRGVNIGEVASINTAIDPLTFEIVQPVEVFLYPERLQARSLINGTIIPFPKTKPEQLQRIQFLVDKGLRAQLRTGSFLTGQQYLGIDFFPNAPKYAINLKRYPLELRAIPGAFDDIEKSITDVIKNTDKLVKQLDTEVIPELHQSLKNINAITAGDSPLQTDMRDSLREVTKAASSIKALSDMLDQQPQSLIFGKPAEESKP
jgi:paraquat-inducible protein B